LIFGKRKNRPAKVEAKREQDKMAGENYVVSLDNIEIIRETPKGENHSPRRFNQDLIGLLWAYSEAEKRVLNLR
jgi:hypothetical protein